MSPVVLSTLPIRVLGDDITGPHSTAIIVGRRAVLACAHSLETLIGGGIFLASSNSLLDMHVEALSETEYEGTEASVVMEITYTDNKYASAYADPYPKIEDEEYAIPLKKARCDIDTVASLAGGDNGRGSALIICKFPGLMLHFNLLETQK